MPLTNSKRLIYTASYVTTQLKPDEQQKVESKPGGGFMKAYLFRSVNHTREDVERMSNVIAHSEGLANRDELRHLLSVSKRLATEGHPVSTIEIAGTIAPISYESIGNFLKLQAVDKKNYFIDFVIELINQRRKIFPIGRLHLERIEMYPAGVEKGELVFSVPMAPRETITISHKEWSLSSREYEEIVQDYFESYSERGVAEKTDASISSENESKRSNAINFGASLSGSYAGVTLTTTFGLTNTAEERESVKQSLQKNREVTEKASSRTRKEHKVSIKVETKTGTEDISAKTFSNNSDVPIRVDYYRMMRKWRTDLYRYGLRQTYDIVIPLPGVRIWALHQKLFEIEKELKVPFVFTLKAQDLNNSNWVSQAALFGVPAGVIPQPPEELLNFSKTTIIEFIPEDQSGLTRYNKIDFDVPAGYVLSSAKATASFHIWAAIGWHWRWLDGNTNGNLVDHVVWGDLKDLYNREGGLSASYHFHGVSYGAITTLLTFGRKHSTLIAWQFTAWNAMKAYAEARYAEKMARLQEERDRLWRQLNDKDTLTLRRLEREELIRLVMQWLLGPDLPFISSPGDTTTSPLQNILDQLSKNEKLFQNLTTGATPPAFNPTFSGVSENDWFSSILFGDSVKFIHQAVEWENLLYFLYPYFWGSENIGREKLLFAHPDPEHERFLRAGYARVVLTIRPGFEESFTTLMEKGSLKGTSTEPYLTIAQEIANFARTNYVGIPPANPELHARPLLFPEQRKTWDLMQEAMKAIEQFKVDHGNYPAKLDDLPSGAPVDAWGNPLFYRVPGLGADYDLISLGADNEEGGEGLDADISSAAGASLVATWNDYTPTSALDIEIDTKFEDIE